MKNVSSLNTGKISETAEYYIYFEDGSVSQINPTGFTIPGMIGRILTKNTNIICCEIGKSFEIEFSLSNVEGLIFKTSSVIKRITKDIYRRF